MSTVINKGAGALVVLLLVLLGLPVTAWTQEVALIGLFADAEGTECSIDAPPSSGLIFVYVVTEADAGIVAIRGRVQVPNGLTFVADVIHAPTLAIGVSSEGIDLAYTECREGRYSPMSMLYLGALPGNVTPDCTILQWEAREGDAAPQWVDCPNNLWEDAILEPVTINETTDCLCHLPIPTEETTWGRVKALYQH